MNDFGVVRLELPFPLEHLAQLSFCKKEGEHSRIKISGWACEDETEAFFAMDRHSKIRVFVREREEEKLIFCGILVSPCLKGSRRQEVELEAAGFSILMDTERKSRSFQSPDLTYSGLMEEILKPYEGQMIVREKRPDHISAPRIQYEESDWEFIKRLASEYGSNVFVEDTGDRPRIYVGLGKDGTERETKAVLGMKQQIEDHLRFRQKDKGWESSFSECVVRSRDYFQIGDWVPCNKHSFQIYGVSGQFLKGEMIYEYRLLAQDGLPVIPVKNESLHGSRIMGTVLAVKENAVKLHLDIDSRQEEKEACWYPFRRTDWYCMPEIGSRAALMLPSDDESEAYVSGLERTDGEENKKIRKPENTYMGTKEGMELKTTPKSIGIRSGTNHVSLEMTEEGIQIHSRKEIRLEAGKSFWCRGETVEMDAGERIRLCTRKTAIVMDELVQMKG